jgi:hypothetical protein
MQLGNTFQGKKCTRCRQVIQSDPAFADDLWGIIAPVLKRAQERCSALRHSRLASALCRRTPVPRRRQETSHRELGERRNKKPEH